jgi:hypothetical protein
MSTGYNDKALNVFREIYSISSGLSKDSYPVISNKHISIKNYNKYHNYHKYYNIIK